ncbi:MAG: MarR family transcriptional regulator [Firmicutes bacterium]|nr:MarR family transcriptional regulator [Bacillota bacterium]
MEEALAVLEALERQAFAYIVERRRRRPRRAPTRLQLFVLRQVGEAGGLSLRDLEGALGVGPAAASQLAHTLVARGWLARGEDPADRRRRLFTLTARGRRVEAAMRRRHRMLLRRVLTLLGAAERRQLTDMARRLMARSGGGGDGGETGDGTA